MRRLPVLLFALLLLVPGLVQAQSMKGFDPERDVAVTYKKGAVVVTAPQGAHLKASFMSVTLKPGTKGTLKAGPLPPTREKDELDEGIWHGKVVIPVAGKGLKGDVEVVVEYQPCTEGQGGLCFPPTDKTLKLKAQDIPTFGTPIEPKPALAAAPAAEAPAPAVEPALEPPQATPPPGRHRLTEGLLMALLGAFGWGLAATMSPCVYPMIPITMAIIGAKGSGKARGFTLSLALVLGMAVTYTTLGVVAALSGNIFGAFAQTPGFLIPVSLLFAVFALSLFGLFEIRLPDALQQTLQGNGPRRGVSGAFVMGLVLGPLAAPCVGPYLGTVLLAISQKGSVILGAAELFVFALGMGVLFLVVGTFSAALPRSGEWLTKLKHVMGLVVLGFAAWNVRFIVLDWFNFAAWSVILLLAVAVLETFKPAETLAAGFRKGVGFLALALGLLLGVRAAETLFHVELLPRGGAVSEPPRGAQGWLEQDLEGALAKAKAGHKVVLVDTYAEWCAQCKELDEHTWPEPSVAAWLATNAVAVRIDTDKLRKDLAQKLGIRSYPTVILLDGDGHELRRSMGFQKPADMLAFLKG